MNEEQLRQWLEDRLKKQKREEMKTEFEANQQLMESTDPNYER